MGTWGGAQSKKRASTLNNNIKLCCNQYNFYKYVSQWLTVKHDRSSRLDLLHVLHTKGPSIKYVTLFLTNFYPPPPDTLCHTSRDPPKYVTHLGPPDFLVGLVKKSEQKPPVQILSQLF